MSSPVELTKPKETLPDSGSQEPEVLVEVSNVSKKFARRLMTSLKYGAIDILREVLGLPLKETLRKNEFWAFPHPFIPITFASASAMDKETYRTTQRVRLVVHFLKDDISKNWPLKILGKRKLRRRYLYFKILFERSEFVLSVGDRLNFLPKFLPGGRLVSLISLAVRRRGYFLPVRRFGQGRKATRPGKSRPA